MAPIRQSSRRHGRRVSSPHPSIAALISQIASTPEADLPALLDAIPHWRWPRGDLYAWTQTLDRFDAILGRVVKDYGLATRKKGAGAQDAGRAPGEGVHEEGMQLNPFTPQTERLVCSILRFTKLLMENCTNRKLYNSFEHLNDLLLTTSLPILVNTLLLLLRPAQQHAQHSPASYLPFGVSSKRLLVLAAEWSSVSPLEMADLARPGTELPPDAADATWTFYRRRRLDAPAPGEETPRGAPGTPTPGASKGKERQLEEGLTTISLPNVASLGPDASSVFADTVEKHDVPADVEQRFELFQKIRVASILGRGDDALEARRSLLVARLLAITVYAQVTLEGNAQSSLLLYSPTLIQQLVGLLDPATPQLLQSAALYALESMARYKSKLIEVLTAVNAGVNQGVLLGLLRSMVSDLEKDNAVSSPDFIDALMSFISYISTSPSGGNMLVGAGLIPLLVQLIENKRPERLPVIARTITLIDVVLYTFTNALALFCNARGLDIMVQRIEAEVEFDIKDEEEHGAEREAIPDNAFGKLPFDRAQVLKSMLRSIYRMMTTSGTDEGLRNLIDTSIVQSIGKTIRHRKLFGPQIFGLVVNIMATFVHNEPTSLGIIQEAKLPAAFYDAVEEDIEASLDTISAVFNAIGALCLNESGLAEFNKRSLIPKMFSIFTSERHLKVLQDKENAAQLGGAVDELVRHQPTLKQPVLAAILDLFRTLEQKGREFDPADRADKYRYRLVALDEEVKPIEEAKPKTPTVETGGPASESMEIEGDHPVDAAEDGTIISKPAADRESKEHVVISFIDVSAKFLESIFANAGHCRDFIRENGLDAIGRLYELPCLPYDFATSRASDSLTQLMRIMLEIKPEIVLSSLLKHVCTSLDETRPFWSGMAQESTLQGYLEISDSAKLSEANDFLRKFITLHARTQALADIFGSIGYLNVRLANGFFLPTLNKAEELQTLRDIGQLQRAVVWENLLLSAAETSSKESAAASSSLDPQASVDSAVDEAIDVLMAESSAGDEQLQQHGRAGGSGKKAKGKDKEREDKKANDPKSANNRALTYVSGSLPTTLTPFLQAVTKMFLYKRTADASHKVQSVITAKAMAEIMVEHISFPGTSDPRATYAYWSTMTRLVTLLLFDERSSQSHLQTPLLVAFERAGGVKALCEQYRKHIEDVAALAALDQQQLTRDQRLQQLRLYRAIEDTLPLLHTFASHKPLLESNQTGPLQLRETDKSSPEYFNANDFLVKLRLSILPVLRDTVQAEWLASAPIVRSARLAVQSLLNIVKAEGEQANDPSSSSVPTPVGAPVPRPVNAAHVSHLVDMGFPRRAAEAALQRRIDPTAAAEHLLMHPELVDEARQAEEAEEQARRAAERASTTQGEDTEMVESSDKGKAKEALPDPKELREELDAGRDKIRPELPRLALRLADRHEALVFDIKDAFKMSGPDGAAEHQPGVAALLDDLEGRDLSNAEQDKPVAVRLRLLAVMLGDHQFTYKPGVLSQQGRLAEFSTRALDALLARVKADTATPVPSWLAALLLVSEAILSTGEAILDVQIPPTGEPIHDEPIVVGPDFADLRQKLFDVSTAYLEHESPSRGDLMSVLRILVVLTRQSAFASELVKRNSLQLLTRPFVSSIKESAGCHVFLTLILRHIVEDPETLRAAMAQQIRGVFSTPGSRGNKVVDAQAFLRNVHVVALRDPNAFVEVVKENCQLVTAEPPTGAYHLKLKPSAAPASAEGAKATGKGGKEEKEGEGMQVDDAPKAAASGQIVVPTEHIDVIVQFLVAELTRLGKSAGEFASQPPPPPAPSTPPTATVPLTGAPEAASNVPESAAAPQPQEGAEASAAAKKDADVETPPEGANDFFYVCLIMQILTELFASYPAAKVSFATSSKKRGGAAAAVSAATATPIKPKAAILTFLLNELIAPPTLSTDQPDAVARKQKMLADWAASVIVAVCTDGSPSYDAKDVPPEVVMTRRFVLDTVSKAIKDTAAGVAVSNENLDARYARLAGLASLVNRLLASRSVNPATGKPNDDSTLHVAKLMLEKNFVVTLTNALAEVDLNFPNVQELVTALLQPLEQLTKIAIKMGRANKAKGAKDGAQAVEHAAEDDALSMSSDSSMDEDMGSVGSPSDREETPDLYRHSALGMYGGDLDDMQEYDSEDEDEEGDEMDDEEMEEMEVDFGDDDTGSESESEPEYGDEDELHAEGDEDEWEDEDDEEGGGEENEGEEGSFIHEGDIAEEHVLDPYDEGPVISSDIIDNALGAPIDDDMDPDHMHPYDEEDMEDDMTDPDEDQFEDELAFEGDFDDAGLDVPDGWMVAAGGPRRPGDPPRLFTALGGPRRSRLLDDPADALIFGRQRPSSGQDDLPAHPLLIDQGGPGLGRSGPAGVARRTPAAGRGQADILLPIIEQMIGRGGAQLLEQVMARQGQVGGGGRVHLEYFTSNGGPAGTIPLETLTRSGAPGGRAEPSASRGTDTIAAAERLAALPTPSRWGEEVTIVQGAAASERVMKIVNHVIRALLPAAREAAAKLRAEEEEQRKMEKEEEEEKRAAEAAAREGAGQPPTESTQPEAAQAGDVQMAEAVESAPAPPAASAPAAAPAPAPTAPAGPMDDFFAALAQRVIARAEAADSPLRAAAAGASTDAAGGAASGALPPAPPAESAAGEPAAPESAATSPGGGVPAEASGSDPAPERVTVTVHGEQVDITDTGIDPTFLEALPDDMREEVINQHFRETRRAASSAAAASARVSTSTQPTPASAEQPTGISVEFLDALPAELRAEVLQQEAIEQMRRERAEAAARQPEGGQAGAQADDMDPASFLASLDPSLRQIVLLDQPEEMLQTLPPAVIAEVDALRDRHRRYAPMEARLARRTGGHPGGQPQPRKAVHRDAMQLLDKGGLSTLVRLLFHPQLFRKSHINKILINLAENSKTRVELLSLLLNILQEGTGDLPAVDRSFSQMSLRPGAPKPIPAPTAFATPKATPKRKATFDSPAGPVLAQLPPETLPNIIAQSCFEALAALVAANEQASLFFLTEHDLSASVKPRPSKKGKGKEKQPAPVRFPIVILLSLLDRPTLFKTQAMMDSFTTLLANITRPLGTLKKAEAPKSDAPSAGTAAHPEAPDASAETQLAPTEPEAGAPSPAPGPGGEAPQEDPSALTVPPQVPHPILKLVVNILTVGECSSKTFQQTLSLIQHLSYIPDARDAIAGELRQRAQEFGSALLVEVEELTTALEAASSGSDVRGSTLAKLLPASSLQARLLRVLKTIDYMYSKPKSTPAAEASTSGAEGAAAPGGADAPGAPNTLAQAAAALAPAPAVGPDAPAQALAVGVQESVTDEAKVNAIYESFQFAPLWRRLGDALAVIEDKGDMIHVATVLLPLIESLMVVCKYVSPQTAAARALRSVGSPRSPTSASDAIGDVFIDFTERHRKILNVMVRNNPSLMSGSFSLLVQNPRMLEFDNKRSFFTQRLRQRKSPREHYGTLHVNVRRQYVFEDSFRYFQRRSGDEVKFGKLSVRFYDEEGVDAGGVAREWYQVLAQRMFNPNYALFQPIDADKLTYQPNRASYVNPEHLSFFKFVGRIIGKAIYDGRLLDAHFTRSFYKHILGRSVDYRDLESVDLEYYKSLVWMLENDITDVLDLTFSVESDEFGETKVIDLKTDGSQTPVTESNKREYVRLVTEHRLTKAIEQQTTSFLEGFHDIIPAELVKIFSENELELLISGLPTIDVDSWRAHTDYVGFNSSDAVIQWFWRALRSFDQTERASFLQFVTGSSRVPLEGFGALQGSQGVQRFNIHRSYDEDKLPQAHTCFNQLDLGQYSSYEMLRRQLLIAINEGGTGFGFA